MKRLRLINKMWWNIRHVVTQVHTHGFSAAPILNDSLWSESGDCAKVRCGMCIYKYIWDTTVEKRNLPTLHGNIFCNIVWVEFEVTPSSAQGLVLALHSGLGEHNWVLGTEPTFALCKASALSGAPAPSSSSPALFLENLRQVIYPFDRACGFPGAFSVLYNSKSSE